MKHRLSYLILVLTLLAAMLNTKPVYAANAVVGNGTAASCTEAAFDNALAIATSGGGTITFNCGAAIKTITFTSSKSILTGNVTINGNNLIILSGGPGVRHFFINDGLTFTLQNITLRDGDSPVGGGAIEASGAYIILESVKLLNNYASNQGGAIYCYIGVDGTLTVNNSLFENNASTNGGAIYNDGCTTTISNTTFLTNQATASGGALHNAFNASLIVNGSTFQSNTAQAGGGLFNDSGSTVTLNSTTFQANTALDGVGLFNNSGAIATLNSATFQGNTGGYGGGLENSGAITINDSLFNLNIVTGSGGGIWNLNGTVTLNRTTISNNSAYEGGGINTYGTHLQINKANIVGNVATGTHGGGIYHGGGTAFISDATISGNQANATTANGGGIYQNSDDNLTLTNVTLADNQAGMLGGGFYHFGRYAVLTNVTIANNLAGVAGDAIYEDSPMTPLNPGIVQIGNSVILGSANNCDGGIFQSFGHNLSQGACASLIHATDQDNYAGSLNLSPLAFNGGVYPMQTMMPTAGSPLIDAGDNTICPSTDQRGISRPQGAGCDIGAYEYEGVPLPAPWIGGVSIASDQSVVAVARPHLGSEVASYIGATAGSTTQYVPMLFKGAFGGTYNAALYIQNVSASAATLSLEFTDSSGAVVYTKTDTLDPHASKGYWLPGEAGLPNGFAGGVKVTSTQPILALGRPHIGAQVMTYNGMSAGATSAWLPMFFKDGFGSYNTALYVQNVTGSSANLTIQYINLDGTVACTDNDTLGANASRGYWSLAVACDTGSLPSGFVGGVKVTSTQDILAVARAHLGTQITTYNGSAAGATSAYVPMLFRNAFGGSYDAALYLQNVSGSSANVQIEYLNSAGTVAATQNVTLAAKAISSIWLPTVIGLPDDFAGGARISSTQNVIAVGRPHLGSEITTYNGASAGSLNASLPMLFKNAYGVPPYNAAFYVQNTSGSAANVEISFYDSAGVLSCIKSIDLAAGATEGFWMPTVTCAP